MQQPTYEQRGARKRSTRLRAMRYNHYHSQTFLARAGRAQPVHKTAATANHPHRNECVEHVLQRRQLRDEPLYHLAETIENAMICTSRKQGIHQVSQGGPWLRSRAWLEATIGQDEHTDKVGLAGSKSLSVAGTERPPNFEGGRA